MRVFFAIVTTLVALPSSVVFGQQTTPTQTSVETSTSTGSGGANWPNYSGEDIAASMTAAAQECVPRLFELIASTTPPSTFSPGSSTAAAGTTSTALSQMSDYFRSLGQQGKCDDADQQSMTAAMDNFKTCSGGLDMMEFMQFLPSALMGGALECTMSIAAERDLLSPDVYLSSEGLPEMCAEVFFGENIMGDVMRTAYLKPDVLFPCLSTLSDTIPLCMYDTWPMPVVGEWLKAGTCFVGSLTPMMDSVCEAELKNLESCLSNQQDICAAQEGCKVGSYNMNMMPPFLGVPLPDACIRIAGEKGLQNGVTLYNTFREECTDEWDGWGAPVGSGQAPPSTPSDSSGADGAGDDTANTAAESSAGLLEASILTVVLGHLTVLALTVV